MKRIVLMIFGCLFLFLQCGCYHYADAEFCVPEKAQATEIIHVSFTGEFCRRNREWRRIIPYESVSVRSCLFRFGFRRCRVTRGTGAAHIIFSDKQVCSAAVSVCRFAVYLF